MISVMGIEVRIRKRKTIDMRKDRESELYVLFVRSAYVPRLRFILAGPIQTLSL